MVLFVIPKVQTHRRLTPPKLLLIKAQLAGNSLISPYFHIWPVGKVQQIMRPEWRENQIKCTLIYSLA